MATGKAIATALGGRKVGGGWMARCPAHDDRTPSLAIRDPDGEKVLVRWHAVCQPDAAETTGKAYVLVGIGYIAEIVGEIAGPTVKQQRHDADLDHRPRNPGLLVLQVPIR
jgi:hypothetical protein